MPEWRCHLSIGIILTAALVYASYSMGYGFLFIDEGNLRFFFTFQIVFISLMSSLVPDFDYRKTRIRNAFGPVLGLFIVISYLYLNRNDINTVSPSFLLVLLIIFILVPLLAGIVIPFKHQGRLHSISFALMWGLIWFGIEILIFEMNYIQAGGIGIFAFLGYFSHLLLDRILKIL